MKPLRTLFLAATVVASLAALGTTLAYVARHGGDLYWDDPGVGNGWAECVVADPGDARLMEGLIVTRLGDGAVVFSDTVDTGVRGFDVAGSGLALEDPWTLSVETDDLEREQHQVTLCRGWLVYGSCGDGEVVTQTLCLIPLDDEGQIVETDDGCCWVAGTVMGTKPLDVYLPLILKDWGP